MHKTSTLLWIAAAKILFWSGLVLWILTIIAVSRFAGQSFPIAFGAADSILGQLIEEMYTYGVYWVFFSGIAGIAYGFFTPQKLDPYVKTFFIAAGTSMLISIPTGMLIIGRWV